MILEKEIKQMAALAKLKLSENQIDEFVSQISHVLKDVENLNEVDIEGIEPMYQVYDYNQVFREDEIEEGLSREEVLQNTVEKQYGYFKLLNIMD